MTGQQFDLAQRITATAQQLRMALAEIHPVINSAGLTKEAEEIGRMKKEIDDITFKAINTTPVLDRIMISVTEDLRDQHRELLGILVAADPAAMSDDELSEAILAAEMFATRSRDYRDSRSSYLQLQNGGQESLNGMETTAV